MPAQLGRLDDGVEGGAGVAGGGAGDLEGAGLEPGVEGEEADGRAGDRGLLDVGMGEQVGPGDPTRPARQNWRSAAVGAPPRTQSPSALARANVSALVASARADDTSAERDVADAPLAPARAAASRAAA